jgi:ribonuclease VapC
MRRLVVDAFAVLAWTNEEPGAPFVDGILADAESGQAWVAICVINLGEVYYRLARRHGAPDADDTLRDLLELDWHVLPVSNELVWAAARLKARFRISYADALALACAQEQEAELVTNDPELCAAQHGVTIRWEPA